MRAAGAVFSAPASSLGRKLLLQIITGFGNSVANRIFLTVYRGIELRLTAGLQDRFLAMLEALIAFFGIISAVIFIAHAIEGYRSRFLGRPRLSSQSAKSRHRI